jgi:hypothetical protein
MVREKNGNFGWEVERHYIQIHDGDIGIRHVNVHGGISSTGSRLILLISRWDAQISQ